MPGVPNTPWQSPILVISPGRPNLGGCFQVMLDWRQRGNRVRNQFFGQSPIHDQDFTKIPDHNVRGFQIPVNDATLVHIGNRLTHQFKNSNQFSAAGGSQGAFEFVGQSFAFDELHREEWMAIDEAKIVNGRDSRALELACHHRFIHKPVCDSVYTSGIPENLNGNFPGKEVVGSLIHHSHPAPSQLSQYPIATTRLKRERDQSFARERLDYSILGTS